jgi:DNA primase
LDADVAGDVAARRGIQIAEKEGFEIKVAKLGKYKDPDDLARKEPKKLSKYIKDAVGVWDFYIDSAFERFGAKTGTQKARFSREIIPILSSIEDKIVQAHYVQEVARRLGVSEAVVSKQIGELKLEGKREKPKIDKTLLKKEEKSPREMAEERLLSVAFRFDAKVLLERKIGKLIKTTLAKRILDSFLEYMKDKEEFDPSLFAADLPEELVDGFTGMVLKEIGGLEDERESYSNEIEMIKKNLKIMEVKEKLEKIGEELKQAETGGKKKILRKKQEEFSKVSNKLKKLEEE